MTPQPAPAKSNKSTGPRSKEGKAASSKNALRHGLASGTMIMPGEDSAAYAALEQSLLSQFQPVNPVETILITDMAKHHWLANRAIRLQAEVLSPTNRKRGEIPDSLTSLHRYQISNQRAFHKCLATINMLRKEQLAGQKQFVSQRANQPLRKVGISSPEVSPNGSDASGFPSNSPLFAQIARDCGYTGPLSR